MIRHRNGKQHPTNSPPPKGDLKGLLISSSILLLAFEFSAVCKISVIFEIPIVVFEKFILKKSIGEGSVSPSDCVANIRINFCESK